MSGLTKIAVAAQLSNATAAAAAAAPALATVGTAAAALKVGLSGVGDAFKAAFDDKTIQSDAKAATQAVRQVESAQRGLADAQRSLADARVQAAERVRDAQQQVRDAERDLADAQREARSVQSELTGARREAARALQDMNQRLAESRLDEKEAVLRLKEAQEELKAAQQQPGTDPDDLARLNIAYERAKLNLTEQRRETKRLATDTAAANKAGVDGSEQVVAARERISEANRTVADRERALAQAQTGVDKARAGGQRQIADAQRGVAEAARALAEAQANAASQTSAVSEAMSKLAPNARSFVNAVKALSPAWEGVRLSTQNALFAGLDKSMTTMGRTTIPVLKEGLTGAATQLNLMAKSAMDAVTSLARTGMLEDILAGANRNLALLRNIPGQMVTAFGQLSVAAQPAFEGLLTQFSGFADRMSQALTRSFKSGGLEQAIGVAFNILSQLGTILADAFGVVTNVLKTATGAGGQVLGVIGQVVAELRRITAMPEVQAALQSVFSAVAQVAAAAAPVIGALVRAVAPLLAEVAPVVSRLAAQLGPVLSRLASELGAALLPIARALMPAIEMIGNALIEVVSALTPLLRPIGELISAIIRAALPVLRPLLDLGVRLIRVLIAPLTSMVRALVPWIGMLGRLFGQVFGALKPLLGPLVSIVATLARVFARMFVLLVQQAMVALRPLMPVIVQLVGLIVRLGLQIISALMPHWRQLVKAGMQLFVALIPLLPMLVKLAVLFLQVGIRVLGVVLPPLIRLATFLVGGFARAFAAVIRWVARVVTWVTKYLGPAFRWLRDNVVKPVVNGIKTSVRWLWENILRPIFNAIKSAIGTVGRTFRWWRDNVVRPVMNGIKTAVKVAWEKGIRPAFNAIKSAVSKVADSFEKAKDGIGKAWAKIKGLTKKPIKWVIDFVYNKGIVGLWNAAAKVLPIDTLKPIHPKGFAAGGYTGDGGKHEPMGVVHGGEFVTRKESTSALQRNHPGALDYMNRTGRLPGYAGGGFVDWVKGKASAVSGAVSRGFGKLKDMALGGVSKAVSAAAKPIRSLIDRIPGGRTGFGKLTTALPKSLLSEALSAIKGSENSQMGGEGVARALKWVRKQAGKPYQWGGAGNPSFDCSGLLSSTQKVIQGKNPKGRLWSTFSFQGKRAPAGWEYHKKSPYQIGITNRGKGHTAGTLAGVNIESRGGDGVVVGARARGYNSPMFGSRWYGFKPAIGGGTSGKSAAAAQATARQMLGEFGWSQKQWPALKSLWQRESGWRWNARNPSSGAYGIVQALPPSKMRSAGADWRTNPATQIKWGMRYIKGRYGSPSGAWAAWNRRSPHWYDAGGWLQPGATMAMNATGKPEAVLTSAQWKAVTEGGGRQPVVVEVHTRDEALADFIDVRADGRAQVAVRRSNSEVLTALGARAGR
ncbi:aggregation-promoting factor C-terminal-like domain-containing protein [Streptomyces smyrnaeus]|uniref:aggregation-promoting factor C-terminal-like domain-containing protein n=1 Tax=Streptomyces smyrnaeus TaxID=1387713 RepID=UPI0033D109B0